MIHKGWGWDLVLGEIEFSDEGSHRNYTLVVGYVEENPNVYLRIWVNGQFLAGTGITNWKNFDEYLISDNDIINDVIGSAIKGLPSKVRTACIQYAERLDKLRAFA